MTTTESDDADMAGQVIGGGTAHSIGSFRFWFADRRWEWSDEVAAIHGYAPGTIVPTTAVLLSHKHPDDRDQVARTLAAMTETGEPFCSRHRIIDTGGHVRQVLVVGDQLLDDDGRVVGTAGYYIDVTESFDQERKTALDDTLPELIEARAVIEQAKGALMLIYGINAKQAFRVLRWRSQETNTKLRALAEQIMIEVAQARGGPLEQRTRFDHLLLTVHERIEPS